MSQASPFSGLIEMPQTGPPPGTTDDDVADAESGGSTSSSGGSSGGFKSFWENHQMIMMVIGLGVLLLTAVLVFRKSQSSSNAASNTTAAGGVPTVQTSDTAMAIAQQNTALEALMNAFQKFTDGVGTQNPTTPTPTPTDSGGPNCPPGFMWFGPPPGVGTSGGANPIQGRCVPVDFFSQQMPVAPAMPDQWVGPAAAPNGTHALWNTTAQQPSQIARVESK